MPSSCTIGPCCPVFLVCSFTNWSALVYTNKHFHFQTLVISNRLIRMGSLKGLINTSGCVGVMVSYRLLVLFNTGKIDAYPTHRSTHACFYLLLFPNNTEKTFHVYQFILFLDVFQHPPPPTPFSITLSSFLAFIYVPFFSIIFLQRKINKLPSPAVRNS